MGTWAEGIFQNDKAADYVYWLIDDLRSKIEATVKIPARLEPDEDDSQILLCNVDLLRLITDHVHRQVWFTWGIRGPMLPDTKTILEWKAKYLSVWDASIDQLDPTPD